MALVYGHKRLDTLEYFYIGIELDSNCKSKLGNRPKVKQGKSSWWKKIVNKVGYKIVIIKNNITNEEAINLEKKLIKKYGRRDLGKGKLVNFTDGGEGICGFKHKPETLIKMKESAKGRVITKEVKIKMSLARLGKKPSKETILKILDSRKGYKHSEKTKEKMRKSNKGFSKKARKNCKKVIGKKVINIKTGKIYNSIREASKFSNYSYTTLLRFFKKDYPNKTNLKLLKE